MKLGEHKFVNTEFLKGFLETARTKSIAKASESLHISHTALSKQLRSLEQQFDVQLFVRSAQGVELTEAGEKLHESASALLDQLSVLKKALDPYKVWQRIRIGTVPDIASQYLLASVNKLERLGHEVEMVYQQSTAEGFKLLFNGELDLLVGGRISAHSAAWIGDLQHEPLFVVMPVGHPWATKQEITLSELSNQSLISYCEGCTIRDKLTDLFASENLPMNIKTEVNFKEVILGYVDNGCGLTVLPEPYVAQLPTDRLVAIPLQHPDAEHTISVFSMNRANGRKIYRMLS